MKGIVFLFVGIVLMVTGVIVSQSSGTVRIQRRRADPETAQMAKYAVGGGLGALGVLFALGGLVGVVRGSQQTKRNQYLMQTGVDAQGTVTFVDKNYSILVNKRPIYTIVEYTYRDGAGNQHTRRLENAPSELVIRRQIQVGAKVAIKYSAQNPSESVLVFS